MLSALNMSSAAALGITARRCSVLQACKVFPFEASSRLRPAVVAPPVHAVLLVLRFASPVLRIFLRAVQQHAAARRGAAAYGDAHLLFGRPKMLISAFPFAPFFVAP